MGIVRYVVEKDYSEDRQVVGRVPIAVFYNLNDAIEYYRWKVMSLKGYDVGYKFMLAKRTEAIGGDGKITFYYDPEDILTSRRNRRGC